MKRTSGTWLTATLLIFYTGAVAADEPQLAVFDIDNRGARIGPEVLSNLGEYFAALLAEGGIRVISGEQIRQRSKAQNVAGQCLELACRTEQARKISVQKFLVARVLYLADSCKITASLYDLADPTSPVVATASGDCSDKALVLGFEKVAAKLTGRRPVERGLTVEEPDAIVSEPAPPPAPPVSTVAASKSDDAGTVNPPETGWLSMNSRPWGWVSIDGKEIGKTTPLIRQPLPAGKHHLGIRTANGIEQRADVEIWPGETTSLILGEAKDQDKSEGRLSVNTIPWSQVAVDGKFIGITPLIQNFPPGKYEVTVTFPHGEAKTEVATVRPGSTSWVVVRAANTERIQFKAGHGLLKVNSIPWGRVWIDGQDIGNATPLLDHQLPAGRHSVLVHFSTGGFLTEEVDIRSSEVTRKIVRQK